ncbi:TonB-dependent receptor [Joostella atrarenae]|uniref:TonB-dependent receptor n=1 Tax=Joostella atrarenae TaxID=679257 RepID=A0ABS9J6U0_9FLAO|nr:TonB-dependent receptor [Joostella atrarenae]MCF8716162.1 TonB-dependent receptor [Joostella atrarenae]
MKKLIFSIVLLAIFLQKASGQEYPFFVKDSTNFLSEVIVIGNKKLSNYQEDKALGSVDDYLETANRVNLIKRGAYAWEPSVNNMSSERLSVTIDGMQIFGACTDKMDPVTSYVDISNLSEIKISSGQSGVENGQSVGGAVDLSLKHPSFGSGFALTTDLGYETNGNYRIGGLKAKYGGDKFYVDVDGIFRKADNYDAGNNEEVLYSQFQKYNIALQAGYKINDDNSLHSQIIYDRATDVGYPALPMDVSLAEGIITSVSHHYQNSEAKIKDWESKIYYNKVTHIMDDSKRPDVPIRMDMPGWSDTYGFYSKLKFDKNDHEMMFNLNGYYNKSLAEMTMYPNDPSQPEMFMYTWPDVRTLYSGAYFKDEFHITESQSLTGTLRIGYQHNRIAEDVGYESLKIFYPEIEQEQNRLLSSIAATYALQKEWYDLSFGLAYGERAPSVSEGYGFFLFNSFDNYDYIGNPDLEKEKSTELNFNFNVKKGDFTVGVSSSYFYIKNYIIGEINEDIAAMTIGADGVRMYSSLSHASIFDAFLNAQYDFSSKLSLNAGVGYNYGVTDEGENLPLISPFSYLAELSYGTSKFNASLQLQGNANQSRYSQNYGEDETPGYGILNVSFGNNFMLGNNKLVLKYGIENLLDTNYSTYSDWNNIPRRGRNAFINLSFILW